MVVVMRVIRRSDVVHSVAATAFRASFEWSLAGHLVAPIVSGALLQIDVTSCVDHACRKKGIQVGNIPQAT